VRAAALLTDGASDAITRYGAVDWAGALGILRTRGPAELIRMVRSAEDHDPDGQEQPRYKRYDDATAAFCDFEEHS
jgi:hypothetical protein